MPEREECCSEAPVSTAEQESACAHVSVASDNSDRFHELLKALDLPETKLTFDEMTELKGLLNESTDVFSLNDSELGCTNIVQHSLDVVTMLLSNNSLIGHP